MPTGPAENESPLRWWEKLTLWGMQAVVWLLLLGVTQDDQLGARYEH